MMKNLIAFIFLGLFQWGGIHAQTGYFGKKNSVEFRYNAAPTIKQKYKAKGVGDNSFVKLKRRIVNSSYSMRYNRIVTNKLSLSFGYEFAGMHSVTNLITYKLPNTNLLVQNYFVEPTINYNGISLALNFFGTYGINPLGVRGGFSLEIGGMKTDYSELAVFDSSVASNTSSNAWNTSPNSFGPVVNTDFSELTSRKWTVTALRWNIGRNFPLSRKLLLKVDLSANIFTVFRFKPFQYDGIVNIIENGLSSTFNRNTRYELDDNAFANDEYTNFRTTYFAYKRFTWNVGFSYFF